MPTRNGSAKSGNGLNPNKIHETFNKRNPKKVTSRLKRNSRQRSEVNYNENSEEEKTPFKKPTPQKYKRAMLEEDSEEKSERD